MAAVARFPSFGAEREVVNLEEEDVVESTAVQEQTLAAQLHDLNELARAGVPLGEVLGQETMARLAEFGVPPDLVRVARELAETGEPLSELLEQLEGAKTPSGFGPPVVDLELLPDDCLPGSSSSSTAPMWDCSICCCSQAPGSGWSCPSQHRFCKACMARWAKESAFPRCPHEGCGYSLNEQDLRQLPLPLARVEAFRQALLNSAIDEIGSRAEERLLRCPNSTCNNVVVLTGGRMPFACPCGAPAFCSFCGQAPYHHHSSCSGLQALRERWLAWIEGGREEYLGLSKKGSPQKSQESRQQQEALRQAVRQHEIRAKDEEWKARHCRCCPRCSRPIQRISGCDKMVCGHDTDTGKNRQPGCGHKFKFTHAPRYVPAADDSESRRKLPLPPPVSRGSKVLHVFTSCSLCGDRGQWIVGPRFRCMHCKAFDVCIKCEARLAREHPQDHVFEILFEPEFDWNTLGVDWKGGTKVRIAMGDAAPSDKRQLEGQEAVVRNFKRGRYTLELSNGATVTAPREHVQPLLTKKQAEKLLQEGDD